MIEHSSARYIQPGDEEEGERPCLVSSENFSLATSPDAAMSVTVLGHEHGGDRCECDPEQIESTPFIPTMYEISFADEGPVESSVSLLMHVDQAARLWQLLEGTLTQSDPDTLAMARGNMLGTVESVDEENLG